MRAKCKCSFVIPLKIGSENTSRFDYFRQSMKSVTDQTVSDWTAVLVDDASKNEALDEYIEDLMKSYKGQIICHKNEVNVGAGPARNIGIDIASDKFGADVIMFQDSDDLSHPMRTQKVSQAFCDKNVDVIYAPFIPIDEYGNLIPEDKFPHNIKNIMENNKCPSVGKEVWRSIVSKEMYINLTSTTNVRTELAKKIPFPNLRSSEDSITWMLYSASGGIFDFIRDIPSKYRMPQMVKNNSLSTEYGKEIFYLDFVNAHLKAYKACIRYAKERGAIASGEVKPLTDMVFENLAKDLVNGGMKEMAQEILKKRKVLEEEIL